MVCEAIPCLERNREFQAQGGPPLEQELSYDERRYAQRNGQGIAPKDDGLCFADPPYGQPLW